MQRLSSNWTLFLKIMIPTLYIVLFGCLGIMILVTSPGEVSHDAWQNSKWIYWIIYLSFIAFLYFTLFQLKRVDMGEDGLYVSDYFKTLRYSFDSIQEVKERNYLLFKTITLYLKQKGTFGKKITFLPNGKYYKSIDV